MLSTTQIPNHTSLWNHFFSIGSTILILIISLGGLSPKLLLGTESEPTQGPTINAHPSPQTQRPFVTSDSSNLNLNQKLSSMDSRISALEAEIEVIKSQSRMVIQNTHLSYLYSTYIKSGLSLVLPQSSTFNFTTDSGLGAFAGIGQYIGRHHVIDVSFEWDIYMAVSARYRFEIHTGTTGGMTLAPVVGFKGKIFEVAPFDKFLESPSLVNKSFFFFGGYCGFPMSGSSLFSLELLYLTNSQTFIIINGGLHFFL